MDLARITDIADRLCISKDWSKPIYIDNGASTAVFKVETLDGDAALKIYDPSFFEGDNAVIEENRIELQKKLKGHDCPYLVDVYDEGRIHQDHTWYLLMEFCPWKSLEKLLSLLPDAHIHSLIGQLVRAVQYLDERKLVHRDIKPANIVISDNFEKLKLLDFGVMRKISHDEGNGTDGYKFIATAQYSPPEFISRSEEPGETGFSAINIYQVGAVLHDMITKNSLFGEEKATKNRFKLYKAVTERQPRVISGSVPPRLIALCLAALNKNAKIRIASVKLEDFLSDADDLEALRRRVARGTLNKRAQPMPNLTVWRSEVRTWVKQGAQLEVGTLGSVAIKALPLKRGQRWQLRFTEAAVPIFVDLTASDHSYVLSVLSNANAERGIPIVEIDADGPNLPVTGIPGALAAQYLYALDLALIDNHSHAMENSI